MREKTVYINEYTGAEYPERIDAVNSECRYLRTIEANDHWISAPGVDLHSILSYADPEAMKYWDAQQIEVLKSIKPNTEIEIAHWGLVGNKAKCSGIMHTKWDTEIVFSGPSFLGTNYTSVVSIRDLVRYYNQTFKK